MAERLLRVRRSLRVRRRRQVRPASRAVPTPGLHPRGRGAAASGVVPSPGVRWDSSVPPVRSSPAWLVPGRVRRPGGGVFEPVVFRAGLAQVGDAGGASVGPGQEMVCLVVQGVVAAAGERAPAVAEPEPVALGRRETGSWSGRFPAGRRRGGRSGPGRKEPAPSGDEAAGHRRRDRPVPVQDGRFLGGAQQGQDRDGDQDLRPRDRNAPRSATVARPARGRCRW